MRAYNNRALSRLAFAIVASLLCANDALAHQYKILFDMNQIYRTELPDAWRLKCDGVLCTLMNSGVIPLGDWKAGFDLMDPAEVYTIDDYYSLTSFNKAVEIVGIGNVLLGCGYVEPTITPEHLTTILPDDKIDERYASQQGKKVLILSRAYNWRWFTDVQRGLNNPKVGGVIWELDTVNTSTSTYYTYSVHKIAGGIRDTLASGKKCLLLVPNTTRARAEVLYKWLADTVPESLDNPNLCFVPAAYDRRLYGFVFYGGDDSVEGAIDRLKELRGDRQTILLNSGFEEGVLAFWTPSQDSGATWSVDGDMAFSGSFSAKYDNSSPHRRVGGSADTDQGSIRQTIHFGAGEPFTASYSSHGSAGYSLTLKVEWLDEFGSVITTDVSTMASGEGWRLHEISGISPAGTVRARFIIEAADTGEQSFGAVYFDEALLTSDFVNAGFEHGVLTPWTTTQDSGVTWSIDRNVVRSGSFSAEYDHVLLGHDVGSGSISQTINVNAGEYFKASYSTQGSNGYALTLRLEWLDASRNVIATETSTMASSNEWNLHEIAGTSPAGTARARCIIEVADIGEPSEGTIYLDDVSLMRSYDPDESKIWRY
ncbi:MAG: hypothetical protein ABFE13_03950 [Phycisphaerales bacterium]